MTSKPVMNNSNPNIKKNMAFNFNQISKYKKKHGI